MAELDPKSPEYRRVVEELVAEAKRRRDLTRSLGQPDPRFYIVHPDAFRARGR